MASIALLTGGSDKPYALGLASALAARGVAIDFIGSDELDCPEVHAISGLRFLNLRGDQREDTRFGRKAGRVLAYYGRLIGYAATAHPRIVHILWNNRFELFDRTLLMMYYRTLGKRVVLTAHNVNAAARNGSDTWVNRMSLRIQYRLCDHLLVHTAAMKQQLVSGFGVPDDRITVVPFGINDTIRRTTLTQSAARAQLGIGKGDRTLLFFGQIAPYKGLEYLVEAMALLARRGEQPRLIVAGKIKRGSEGYWRNVEEAIARLGIREQVIQRVEFIPDDQVEPFFKAADAVVLPYVEIFQSGVPFLAFSFGLPVVATDVGSLREDVTSETGVLCRPTDPADLARAISEFYRSDLHPASSEVRHRIRRFAQERHSWQTVSERATAVYASLAPGYVVPGVAPVAARHRQETPSECRE